MILVTGGAGYIGSVVTERLLVRGEQVVVYDNLSRGYRDAVPGQATFVRGDIGDRGDLRQVFARYPIESVMHFAAFALVGESSRDPGLYYDNNVAKALVLLEEVQAAGVGRFVFSSTCAVFGEPASMPIDESAPMNPVNPYGETKLALERALRWRRQAHGLAYFCLRYFNACGASRERGERHDPETHLIPLVLQAAAGEREGIRVFGDDYPTPDGTCIRDYIHVEDLADAHIRTLDAPREASGGFNIGAGRGHSVREVIEAVRQVTGRRVREMAAPRREGDPPELVADPRKIEEQLGWRARHDLESAIRSAWDFKRQRS